MNNKFVLLFNPQPRCDKDEQVNIDYKIPPMSLLAIAAPLDKAGYQVRIVDASVDADYENKIKSFAPNTICLGITSFTGYQIYGGLAISKSLKSTYPQIPIIWGGYHPTILPEQTVANEYVDIVVRGQGEKTFFELVKALDEGLSLDNVSGITFKKNGVIINNPDRVIENINNFPCTPYHLIDVEKYIFDSIGTRTIGYRTSQGCPYSCKFCAEPMVTKGEWSGLYATRVADEIEYLVKKYNVNAVLIFDPNFFVDKERVRDICKGIINKRLNIRLGNLNGRAEQLLKFDDQIWRLLKQAGCTDIMIGAESGSEEILRHINKGASVEDTIEVKRLLSKYDITVYISLIFGLPSDDEHGELVCAS